MQHASSITGTLPCCKTIAETYSCGAAMIAEPLTGAGSAPKSSSDVKMMILCSVSRPAGTSAS